MSSQMLRRESGTAPTLDTQERTVSGIAVPYNSEIEIWDGYYERIAPNAWQPRAENLTGMKLLWRHNEIIGTITHAENRDEGMYISARISQTTLGNDVYALVKDGAIDRFSIGFIPIEYTREEHEDGEHTTHTLIDVREVSLVPWPAYEDAKVEHVRHTTNPTEKENHMNTLETRMEENTSALEEIRAEMQELEQRLAFQQPEPTPVPDSRNAAQFLVDLVTDQGETRAQYEQILTRAFTGTKSDADPTMTTPEWLKDLTRIYNTPDQLKPLFSTGSLPEHGMELEYAVLGTNTMDFAEYTEGEDIVMGKVTLKKETAPIKAYAGGTSLTRRAIERTRLPILQRHLEALALAAGASSAKAFAATFAAAVKKQANHKLSITKNAAALTPADLIGLIVDAADEYRKMNLNLDGLIVNKDTFKALASLTATDGRSLMDVTGTGVNTIGKIALPNLSANMLGIRVVPNFVHTGNQLGENVVGAFYNSAAICSYESPIVQLQDENIINLSKEFGAYRYAATAVEIPTALVPLKLGA